MHQKKAEGERQTLQVERTKWEEERENLTAQAEKGYMNLYSDITTKAQDVVKKLQVNRFIFYILQMSFSVAT